MGRARPLPVCGSVCVFIFVIRGCSHVCVVWRPQTSVCLGGSPGNILATHWPAGHPPQHHRVSLATARALLSLSQTIFLSAQEQWECGRELGRSCDDISPSEVWCGWGPGRDAGDCLP